MSLLDAIEKAPRKGPLCSFTAMRRKLTPDQQAELDAVMADDTYTGSAIAAAIRDEWNLTIGQYTVNRHRKGECRCGTR